MEKDQEPSFAWLCFEYGFAAYDLTSRIHDKPQQKNGGKKI